MAKILAIDDKQDNLISISALLKNLLPGCNVITAQSGPEGIEKAVAENPDTILLAIKMPGMDGYETSRRLKSHSQTQTIPIIMLTAIKTDVESHIKGLETGADAFLSKPIDPYVLIAHVNAALRLRNAEKELRASEERYRSLFANMNESIALCEMVYDADGNPVDYCFKDMNPRLKTMLKIDRSEALGQSAAAVHGMKVPPCLDICARVVTSGRPQKFETYLERLEKYFKFSIFPTGNDQFGVIFSDNTEARRAKQVLEKGREELELRVQERSAELLQSNTELKREILERKRTENELKEKSSLLASILDSAFYGIITCKAVRDNNDKIIDFEYLMMNKAAMEVLDRNDLVGRRILDEFPDNKENGLFDWYVNIVKTRKPDHIEIYRGHDLNMWHYIVGVPLNDGFTMAVSNITQQKLLQDQLIQAERLAATGELAASIAHEINSPLQGISAILSLMARTYKQDQELLENIHLLKGAFNNIRDIVKSLLDLNRPANKAKQPVDIHTIINNILLLLRNHLKKNRISVNLNLLSHVPHLEASPQQMGQVLINLLNNAVESLNPAPANPDERRKPTEGGTITISTRRDQNDIIIEVSDTGPGIPNDALEHLFKPFYTTKNTIGMGVGLSICQNIIEDHQGSISAQNSPEGGAVFTIRLPLPTINNIFKNCKNANTAAE